MVGVSLAQLLLFMLKFASSYIDQEKSTLQKITFQITPDDTLKLFKSYGQKAYIWDELVRLSATAWTKQIKLLHL